MLKNKKKLAFTLLAGTSYILSLSGTALAQVPQVPTAPYSLKDPAAQLNPALHNAPDIVYHPKANSQVRTNSNAPVSAVGFNMKTRKTQVLANSRLATSATASSASAPYAGLSPKIQSEPSGAVKLPTGTAKPNSVIGTDNRVQITNTQDYPWRAITKLYVTFPKSSGPGGCTGTLIANKYVLTAAHCVYDKAEGGWAKTIEVIPGLNGTYKPYGSAYATYMRTYSNWTSSEDPNYDIALITLDRPIGTTTGWLGYGYYSSYSDKTANIAGYPGDKGRIYLYYHYGSISSSNSYRLYYQIDTYGGQSGSGIYYKDSKGDRYIFGVHTTGVTPSSPNHNSGTRLDSEKYNRIKSWISSGT